MTRRTIGILGGMGPLATADLYTKIIQATPANSDQEHLPVIIHADPSVPDRTAALLSGGEDPTPWLVRGASNLASAGAEFIVMPCNTAHAFIEQVQDECPIPIVNMIDEAAREVQSLVPRGASAGILATGGTVAAGLYQSALERHGLQYLTPGADGQSLVMETIRRVKAGKIDPETVQPVLAAVRELEDAGAAALLAACTELPVVLRQDLAGVPLIDPTDVLARAAVRISTSDDAWIALLTDTGKVRSHVN